MARRRASPRAFVERIVTEATRLNPAGLQWSFGVRGAAGIALVLVAAYLLHQPLAGAAAAMGAQLSGFAGRQGVYRSRAAAMSLTTLAMAVGAFVGCASGGSLAFSVLAIAVWGFGYGLAAALGPVAGTIGTSSALALVVFGQFALPPAGAAVIAAAVVAGGAVQTTLLVALWPFERFTAERRVLSTAFRTLAGYAHALPAHRLRAPASAAFMQFGDTLSDMQPFAARGSLAAFQTLFDEIERMRAALGALAAARYVLERRGESDEARAIDRAAASAGDLMDALASALEADRSPAATDVWEAFDQPLQVLSRSDDAIVRRAHGDLDALLGQLRTSWQTVALPAPRAARSDVAPHAYPAPEGSDALELLRANLTVRSEYARHGLRLSVTLALCVVLEHVLPIHRGYWIPLTAAIVLRPDFGATYARGVARLLGTFAGVVVAAGITALHPHALALLALAVAFACAGYVLFEVNYALFTVAITGYVVFLLAFGGLPEGTALVDRIIATSIGGAVALGAYALWPTWERRLLPRRLAELFDALHDYGRLLLGAYLDPTAADAGAIARAQHAAWLARSNADASFGRMAAEPVAPKALTVRSALGILASTRRYGLALLSLNAHRSERPVGAREAFAALAADFDEAVVLLAGSLRARRPPAPLPKLRDRHGAFVAALDAAPDSEGSVAAAETDLMVDALNSAARILRRLYVSERRAVKVEERPNALRTTPE